MICQSHDILTKCTSFCYPCSGIVVVVCIALTSMRQRLTGYVLLEAYVIITCKKVVVFDKDDELRAFYLAHLIWNDGTYHCLAYRLPQKGIYCVPFIHMYSNKH